MRIELVGPGRIGRSMDILLRRAGHAPRLRGRGDPVDAGADMIWLTVPDSAIADAARDLPAGPLVAHASGATALDPLAPNPRRGSLHPLMTFPGPETALPDLSGVAAAIDAAQEDDVRLLERLARSLGLQPVHVPGDRRLYHAAAVMAGNLTTVLMTEAGRVLAAAGVPPDQARAMLLPVALQSARNAIADPCAALTGPVVRRDEATLQQHRAALAEADLHDLIALYDDGMRRAARIRDAGE